MFGEKQYNSNLSYSIAVNQNEFNAVKSGRGVYAWIESHGMFYSGDIPGVHGILFSKMANSFSECYSEMEDKLNSCVAVTLPSFRQEVPFEKIAEQHPHAEIVFVPIKSKR